ncbi:MAG: rhodoquinone biosynthesis methyltransferase RquA, partial [Steroidobacteraceae bacterium]
MPDVEAIAQPALPDYLVDTYAWAYLRPRSLHLLDRHFVVNGILWGNYRSLAAWACAHFSAGDRLLQAASVYGDLSARLAERVGASGFLDVIDIAPL